MWRCLLTMLVILLSGCSRQPEGQAPQNGALSVWAHAGQAAERQTLEQQVAHFNGSQREIQVQLTFIPEQSYNAQVQAAAVAGDLPDLLELDGPYLANYAWQGHLQPLEGVLRPEVIAGLLPSIIQQGRYHDRLYGIGVFDSGLGLYARRGALSDAGIRIPDDPENAWTGAEFTHALTTLAGQDEDGMVLDLKLNYSGEWFTYAFSPLLQSAGGDLIDRSDYRSTGNLLNGPSSVAAMNTLQGWITQGYVDPNVDDAAFVSGRVALSWAGHWEYSRYAAAVGDDLALLPLPDMGSGSRTGQGSWVWGITRHCSNPRMAARFLEFLLQTDQVLAMASANGAAPATLAAIRLSPTYETGGALSLYSRQLRDGFSVPRPQTPAYPVITSAFQQAFATIRDGGNVQTALNRAAATIDQDIQDNRGYPPRP